MGTLHDGNLRGWYKVHHSSIGPLSNNAMYSRKQLHPEVTTKSTSRDIKVQGGSENVRHKNMYRDFLLYPSVYLDIVC